MKTLILLLFVVIACSCSSNVKTKELNETHFGKNFYVMEIDSCEYIYLDGWFSHKGNCKFCKERNK